MNAALKVLDSLAAEGNDILPIMSETAYSTDTRFAKCADTVARVESICKKNVIHTVSQAEPIGPSLALDMLIVCPCTGNTLAKVANGITDTSATMAIKAQLRSNRPVVIAAATNDALSSNLKNIGALLNRKNIYFVPFSQDDPENKPHSLVCYFSLLNETLLYAFRGKQLQPVITSNQK